MTANAISVVRDGHRTFFKWHRGRRRASDPAFTGRRIVEGMTLGASVEVDLVIHGGSGFAVLHNLSLEKETTGRGLVRNTPATMLREMSLRDNSGRPIDERVMLLEDLAALIERDGAHPEGLLQLDYKEDAAALTDAAIASFATAIRPVARHFILSSGDAEAVRLLSEGVPGLRIGYDPCHMGALERLMKTHDYAGFVAEALIAAPDAELQYIAYPLVLEAERDGFDIIGAFHAHARRVDAYTVKRADDEGMAVIERLLALRVDQITTDDPDGVASRLI